MEVQNVIRLYDKVRTPARAASRWGQCHERSSHRPGLCSTRAAAALPGTFRRPAAAAGAHGQFADRATRSESIQSLLGYEGTAASDYFSQFSNLIKPGDNAEFRFEFAKRNRRPPGDPVNALLSFAYAMLTRQWTVTLSAVGFDPFRLTKSSTTSKIT